MFFDMSKKGVTYNILMMLFNLYKYMYTDYHMRVVKSTSLDQTMYEEVLKILELANKCPASKGIENTDVCNDLSKIDKKSSKCNCKC